MKSSAPSKGTTEDEAGQDGDDTPVGEAARPAIPLSRPSLVRSPHARVTDTSPSSEEREVTESEEQSTGASSSDNDGERAGDGREDSGNDARRLSEEARLVKLRDAVNAKLLHQQRMRRSHGSPKPDSGSFRVSPIQEEDGIMSSTAYSPKNTLAAMRTKSSVSTESTGSTKTVRAANATPSGEKAPLRTPSYPFPYVPGTPRTWSSNFHQPFTTLSPTVAGQPGADDETPGRNSSMFSVESTPGPSANAFVPPGSTFPTAEDPRFPTPNLYDLVLQLNAEPGLEQWWTTVTNLMHDDYKADRVTLVMPLDPTDIENVPWGQKATFSMNGPEEFVPHRTVLEQTFDAAVRSDLSMGHLVSGIHDVSPQKLHPERLRPRLEARHSYAGHGHGREVSSDSPQKLPIRPAGPARTATHAAGMPTAASYAGFSTHRQSSSSTLRHSSLNDPDFSSVAGVDAGPYAEVFPTLKALENEVRPLIEPGGVNRVLDRGRVVTVTRDYHSENPDKTVPQTPADESISTKTPRPSIVKMFGNYRSVFAADDAPALKDYEEYEQNPTSPWAQSPAPSPAIQADEDANPFFASGEQQVENAFDPSATTPRDYSQLGQVEAIGVEHASTVIHIPLVHPTMSKPMQSLKTYPRSKDGSAPPQRSNTLDMERKAPIAILSVLGSTVPYPRNLIQSLKLLGPHLATSFAVSRQFSSANPQNVTIRHRRTVSGHTVTTAPMTIEPTSLQDIMNADIDRPPGSLSDTVTSPSDYSGRSRHSPSGSIVGTPGWDPSTHGWTASKSATGTPAVTGTEMVDNYFEAKKRWGHRSLSNASGQAQNTPARTTRKVPSSDGKPSARKPSPSTDEDTKTSRHDRKMKPSAAVKDDKTLLQGTPRKEHSPPRISDAVSPRTVAQGAVSHATGPATDTRHSRLHSYGADLQTSFGPLPDPIEPRTPGAFGHGRKSSYNEDMPPPSERLLRTIIDSVPVQIFTADPDTGKMTWVNSKFLVFRGQEARQVLAEPWSAIHPDDRNEFMATWQRSLRTAQQLQQKVRLERFDGAYRWFYVRAAPLKDKRQKIVHWIGTMMDFHEQHIAETNSARQQETAASEAKYRALANSSPQIVFAVNKIKGVTFCNTQWVHFSGQSEAQALGVGFMDHVHPDDLTKCRLPTFDEGSDLPKNVPTSVPPELNRKPSASTQSTSSNGSSETEKPGWGGWGSGSIESSPISTHMPQRKLSELANIGILKVSMDADGRPSYSTEVRLKSKDGQYRWHLVRVLLAEPLLQLGGEEETWYGTCTDISDHKALERDLKETMDEKSRFLSNMSHEIRTPLNGIWGMVNFLIDSNLTSEQMEHANIIRASTEGLRGLINDILDLSKAEAGMIQLNTDWFYVRALIEEVNDLTSAMAIDKGLELNYLVEEEVPGQIKGDRFRIRQILLNIIGNAIKFTQTGEVFVRCSTQQPEDHESAGNELFIKFEVIDTGRGFTDHEAEHLFKRFSQIDGSSTRQHGGTGLGLVISKQLAQLHGGDMTARGVPDKGATFTFAIKTTLPSEDDQPPPLPTPLPTPGGSLSSIPPSPAPMPSPVAMPKVAKTLSFTLTPETQAKPSPKFAPGYSETPSPYATSPDVGRESPSVSSTNSSIRSAARTSSLRSERSSASSYVADLPAGPPMKLAFPADIKLRPTLPETTSTGHMGPAELENLAKDPAVSPYLLPPMFSILVICPLKYSRQATVQHIDKTLPKNVPHQITSRENVSDCLELIDHVEDPVHFTHIVAVLQDVAEITALMEKVLKAPAHQSTGVVIITDLAQRKKIMERAPEYNYDRLALDRRLRFVFKPLKPSRFAIIFDPQKEREMSTDRNQDSAQQVALTQKQVFDDLARRLGNKAKRVLLVEDNRTNQLVILKFLSKVSIDVETALDGVECTNKVFSQPHGYYSIILCDLHMPNKDGYQTCKEIRQWELHNKYRHLPIIALSANVLGDVHQKCVDAGFNSYMTKPVDFKELSSVLMSFMDPRDPSKPHEFMKLKRRQSVAPRK